MKIIAVYLACFFASFAYSFPSWFSHDSAVAYAQKENWEKSKELLKHALVNNSGNADVVYDAGVASFKTNEYEKALAYFENAAKEAKDNKILQEQSYFNAGNCQVKLNHLQEAIDAYDQALLLNPKNEKALHNKEIVKKMLEQQKEQQKQEDKKEKQDKQNDKKENQKQDSSDQQDENNQNKSESDMKNDAQKKEDKKNKKDEENNSSSDKDEASDKQESKENESKKGKNKSDENIKEEQQKKQNKESGKNPAPEKKENAQQSLPQEGKNNADEKLTPVLAHFLDEQEKKDAKLNKKMIKALAGKKGGVPDGYNNW